MTGRLSFAGAAALICAAALVPTVASAATINVETTADAVNADAVCSLREALDSANADVAVGSGCENGAGADTISLPPGEYTLTGTAGEDVNAGGDLDVRNTPNAVDPAIADVTFDGAGDGTNPAVDTILDLNDLDRAIQVQFNGNTTIDVVVQEMRIRDGSVLTVGADGGGIFMSDSDGTLDVLRATLEGNDAADDGGGIEYTNASLPSTHWLEVTDSEFVGNTAGDWGGAMNVDSGAPPNPNGSNSVEVVRSTFTGNHGGGEGGAIYLENAPRMDVLNTTFTQNTSGGGGSAIAHGSVQSELHVQFSTIAGNSTTLVGGAGGVQTDFNAQRNYFNGALIAGNTANGLPANCAEIDSGPSADGIFQSKSFGYSLDTGTTCDLGDAEGGPDEPVEQYNDPTGDVSNAADPGLGPLAENGGLTRTLAIGAGSSALDKVPNTPDHCRAVDVIDEDATGGFDPLGSFDLTADQRGLARPISGGLCDIGAFEAQSAPPPCFAAPCEPTKPAAKKCKKKKKKKKSLAGAAKKKKKGCKKKKKKKK
jgi:trimeric autotransporter adhesin